MGHSRLVRGVVLLVSSSLAILAAGCGAVSGTPAGPPPTTSSKLTLSSTSVDFGTVTLGTKPTKTITATADGTASVTISQWNLSGSAFSVSSPALPLTLSAGQSATVVIAADLPASGVISQTLNIVSDATNSPTVVGVTATGISAPSAVLSLNPSSFDFGSVAVGSSSTKSVVISNVGTASATLSQINVTGAAYSVSGVTLPVSLAAGATTSVTVKFAPSATGSVGGNLSFVSTASNSPATLTLSGTGTTAPLAQLTANPTSVNFGNVSVGSSGTQTVTISNTGNVTVTISQITTSGTGFTLSGVTVPLTLNPSQSSSYTAKFAPASAGSASGQISVLSTATNSPTAVALSGTGVAVLQLNASPGSLTFGNVVVGTTATLSGTLTAAGGSVTISSATVTGAAYSISGLTLPKTLAAGQSTTYSVVFAPAVNGSSSGSVTFSSNASNTPSVSLSGTGITPQLNVSPASLAFGNVVVGSTGTLSGTLIASGGSITVSSAAVAGNSYSVSGLAVPVTLAAGQSTTFSVIFAPGATGSSTGSITFSSTANSPSMSLSGTGVNSTSGPTCGLLNDGLVHLPTNYDTFTPPAVGQSYVDPVFGCTVKRLTDGTLETLFDGNHPGLMNYYSTFTALNAADNMLFIIANDGDWDIRDTNGNIVITAGNMPSMSGHPVWDASNGSVYYFASGNSLTKGIISGNSVGSSVVHTFTEYSAVTSPDSADLSQDGDHIGLVGQNSNGTMDIFVWSISQQLKTSRYTTSCTGTVAGATQPGCVHKLQLSANNLLTIQFAAEGSGAEMGVRLWNGSTLVHLQDVNTNHYDTGYDLNGNPIYSAVENSTILPGVSSPCPSNWGLDVRQMNNTSSAICLLDNQPYWHISYRGSASQPWIAISFFDSRTPGPEFFTNDGNYQKISTSNWQLYEDEIVVAKVDVSKIYRLAHARSRSMENYWAQPHATISRDGKYVVFTSNMAHPNGCPANMHVAGDCSDVYLLKVQ